MKMILVAVLALISSLDAFAHGVERGSVNFENAGKGLSAEMKSRIELILRERCAIASGASLRVTKVIERLDEIDQGFTDFYYTVEIEMRTSDTVEAIVLEIVEYAISHPAYDHIELLSALPENLCK